MLFKLKNHEEDPDSVKVEYPGNVTVECKSEDMSWEEIQKGLVMLHTFSEFEKRYGECPKVSWLWGFRKAKRWIHECNIFREGVKAGEKWAYEWIKNSGWMKEDVQKEFERKEKEEEEDGVK